MDYTIQNLMNMEAMLGYGCNLNVPCVANGYRMNPGNSYYGGYNPYYYGSYNPTFNGGANYGMNYGINNGITYGANPAPSTNQQTNSVFQGMQKQDVDALTKYYTKTLDPSESFLGCLAGATGFGILFHPRAVIHPRNTKDAFKGVTEMFKNAPAVGELWKTHNPLMQDAYTAMHRLEARTYGKLGLFRKSYLKKNPVTKEKEIEPIYFELKKIMEDALKSGKPEDIAKATEMLNSANVWDGPIGRFTKLIRGKERLTPQQALDYAKQGLDQKPGWIGRLKNSIKGVETVNPVTNKFTDAEILKKVEEGMKPTFKNALKRSGGKGFVFFVIMNLLMGVSKIKTAYSKDKKTGNKQVGQTVFKSLTDAAGWTLGEAGALALFGAKVGTRLSPGLGTAIGALVGMIGGSIGMWVTAKASKAIVGQDVADKVEAERLAQTQEGQMQLLQTAYEAAQKGDKKMDAATQQALYRALNTMA
ncbi:MAG: hypothetical protein MJ231_02765 [bacterium]|nr:hypothetical protein [bacterium]